MFKSSRALVRASIIIAINFSVLGAQAGRATGFHCPQQGAASDPIPSQEVRVLTKAVEKFEESPFAFACQDPGAIKGRPKTGLLTRALPASDGQGRKTTALFDRLIVRVEKRVAESENMAGALKRCLSDLKNQAVCDDSKTFTQSLPEYVREARYHLSLAQSPSTLGTWLGTASRSLNTKLASPGTYKDATWKPLSREERKEAQAALDSYISDIEKAAKTATSPRTRTHFVSGGLIAARYRHHVKYHEMLSELPLVQYLTSEHPAEKEISQANESLLKNLEEERAFLTEMSGLLSSAKKGEELSTDLLKLLNYSSLLEEVLLESPEYCGLAASLVFTASNREIGNSAMMALPVLAVSLFAPPAAATVIGFGAGTVVAYSSQQDLNSAKARAMSQVYADPASSELDDMTRKWTLRNVSVATLPLGLGLASVVTSKVGAAVNASSIGFRVAASSKSLAQSTASATVKAMKASLIKVSQALSKK